MRKYAKIMYGVSLALVVLLLAFIHFHERIDEYVPREDADCEIFTDYEVRTYENEDAPLGITQEYKWTLTDVPARNGCITFYTVHQEVKIYIGDELIYRLAKGDGNWLSDSVGCDWAKAYLQVDDEDQEIRILVNPIYKSSIDHEIKIYYGNFDTITLEILHENLPVLVIATLAIIIGSLFIVFVLINIQNKEMDRNIAMLGLFSLFAGLWKIADMTAAPFIFKNPLILSTIAIISLPMMVAPFIFYVQSQLSKATHRFLDFLCIIASVVSIEIILLQLTGVSDLRQTLIMSHVMIVIMVFLIMAVIFREAKRNDFSIRLRITMVCCLLCLAGTIMDMIVYYVSGSSGTMVYGLLSFILYALLMGYISLKEARKLIERGKEAKRYEELAMHDELTGLYSRAFYSDYLKKHNMQNRDCYIVMLDVNNLKQCNDSIGHDCGDELLKNSAGIIEYAFQPNGKCVRLGGDEFCVMLRGIDDVECKNCLKLFDDLLIQFNTTYPNEFPVNIAYGYAHFDSELDFDFADTLRRADKMMYQMKMMMKTGNKSKAV